MQKKPIVAWVLAVLITVSALIMPGTAVYAYPTSYGLSVPVIMQPKTQWCWAASGTSVVRYVKNVNISVSTFAYAVMGNYNNVPQSLVDVKGGLTTYGVSSSTHTNGATEGSNHTINLTTPMPFGTIQTNIYQSRPIIMNWIYWLYNSSLGEITIDHAHIMVITGYTSNGSSQTVEYMDPGHSTMQIMSYSTFLQSGQRYWGASLRNIYAS